MLVLLFPLGVLAAVFAVGMFTLGAWLKALIYAFEARFVAAGVWLCVGIFMVDVINVVGNDAAWHDFTSLYIVIMIGSVAATALRHTLMLRREC